MVDMMALGSTVTSSSWKISLVRWRMTFSLTIRPPAVG